MRIVFDLEADNLLDQITLLHCLCYYNWDTKERVVLVDYNDIIRLLTDPDLIIIGHNIVMYDVPAAEKILGIKITARRIDTLAFSWYLYPHRSEHGLESWGETFGIVKPAVTDWTNLAVEDYIFRCSEDVRINVRLFELIVKYLTVLYETRENVDRICNYLTFKLDCAREQEEQRWKVDVEKAKINYDFLYAEMEKRRDVLAEVMPPVPEYREYSYPAKPYKKDGELSSHGIKWFTALADAGLPEDQKEPFKVIKSHKMGNPASPAQLKSWLYSLGWVPETFKFDKDTNDKIRKIEQINLIDGSDLCPSVRRLIEVEPKLAALEKYYVVKSRLTIIYNKNKKGEETGILTNLDENNYIKASIKGLTNTLRFKHKVLVNLPTLNKQFGQLIRELLICEEDEILCGADVSSLEDSTKQHYMFFFDPDYVATMQVPGFSPHLDIGVQGGMITQEDSDFYTWFDAVDNRDTKVAELYYLKVAKKYLDMCKEEQEVEIKRIGKTRKEAKQVNFAAVYGVGAPKLAATAKWEEARAQFLLDVYWQRNWSVKEIANSVKTTEVGGQMWLFNPISKFWYSLRFNKDKFSTLNQGTGVYVFDTWVKYSRNRGVKMIGQFHDEVITRIKNTSQNQEWVRKQLVDSMADTNAELNLNVKIGISVKFGPTYASIH